MPRTTFRVWLYTDEFATIGRTQEDEYKEIESRLVDLLPGLNLKFERDKRPHDLSNGSADVYVFDIGGMCYSDLSG